MEVLLVWLQADAICQSEQNCSGSIAIVNKFILLPLLFIALASSVFAQTQDSLQDTIEVLLSEQKISGAVWATVSENGAIKIGAAGYKNMSSKTHLTPSDKVHVGSVSKTLLAAGFLRLATVNAIDLDDPVSKYLPTLPINNRWGKTHPVTIRHLLDHTSGLTDVRLWQVFSTSATPSTPLESVYKGDPSMLRIQAKPGSIYSYSNLGFTILGMVIEKLTGDRYEHFLDENLLKPLGMLNSTFEFVTQAGDNADDRLAAGHFENGLPVYAMPGYLRPAGQFTTTAEDMGIFLRFLMSDGTINGTSFIRSDYLRSIGNQRQTDAFKNGVPYGDALGAYSRDRYGVIGLAKNGNILGFSSMIYLFPEHKKAFFISYNMDSETANYDLFNEALVKYLDITRRDFLVTQHATEIELQQWNGYYVPVITKVEPFALIDKLFSHTKVTIHDKGALLEPAQGKKRELLYQGNQLFSMQGRTNISHSFYKNEVSDLLITDGIRTIKKINWFKLAGIATSFFLGLTGIILVFTSSLVKLIIFNSPFRYHPVYLPFLSILILLISIILIANQPFFQLGDLTIGNVILAVGSTLLPLLAMISLVQIIKSRYKFWNTIDFLAIVFILQLTFLLMANNLIPIIIWQ
jgi:CubicO group peptidase (beta-lactamase class C family)